jgi:hypothetical protein
VGKYLDLLDAERPAGCAEAPRPPRQGGFGRRLSRFGLTAQALAARCPAHVPVDRWQQAAEDGERFLAKWERQAEALGWSPDDLFGLMPVPDGAHRSLNRAARYDRIGLAWVLLGRPVVALTESTAAISGANGAVIFRRSIVTGERT